MKPLIKKLSVFFLAGAILVSSLSLGVSALINHPITQNNTGDAPNVADNYRIYGAGLNGQNLTSEVANIFARQLVEINPQGPVQNEDGNVQIFIPTSTELLSYLTANPPSLDILTPKIDDSRIRIIDDFDSDDISHYLSEMSQVQSDASSDPAWQASLSAATEAMDDTTQDASYLPKISEAAVSARDRLYDAEVPLPLVPLHRSFLATFSTMASYLETAVQDPVGAVALFDDFKRVLGERIANQDIEMEKVMKDIQDNSFGIVSGSSQKNLLSLADILKIKTAYATAPVIDYAHIAAAIGEWVKQFIEWAKVWAARALDIAWAAALAELKRQLIEQLGQKVIEWAEGAGVPGYVTNWLVLQAKSAAAAATGLISRETAKVCGNAATAGLYGDVLASALGAAGVQGSVLPVGEPPGCPTASSGFYDRGGYDPENFLNSLQYNVYNDLLRIRDRSVIAAARASQAAVNEGLSGRGLLDVKKCDDGTPVDNEGTCGNGEPARTVTPGSSKQDLISKVLGAAQDTIATTNNEKMYATIGTLLARAVVNYALQETEGIFSRSGDSPPEFPGGGVDSSVVDLSANPTTVAPGASSTLYWFGVNVTECSLGITGGAMNPVQSEGSMNTPAITTNTSWTIECAGSAGSVTDTATVTTGVVGGGGGSIPPESLFVLTPAERAVFSPPSYLEWSTGGLINQPLKSVWEAFDTGSLPATLGDADDPDWYEHIGSNGSQNHGMLWNGIGALGWALQGNAAKFDERASKAIQLLNLDQQWGHQRHESLGYGPYWTGPVAAMALAGLYAPAGSTMGPQLLTAARTWWQDHMAILSSLRMPDGQVAILGSRQNAPYETGGQDTWYAMYSALVLQLADPIAYGQLHPEITDRITTDGQPKRVGGNGFQWNIPKEGVNLWLILRALQSGALLPGSGGQTPSVSMDVYRWTSGSRTYVASPKVCGYAPWRWKVSWAPGEVLRVEVGEDPGSHMGKGPWPSPEPLGIPAGATHLFGPGNPETSCSY